MNALSISRLFLFAAVAALSSVSPTNAQQNGVKVDPYTGPPIYLEDPEAPPQPRRVRSTTDIDKYDNGNPRIERTITVYSDDSIVSNGVYREYYPGGELFVQGEFDKGAPSGEWTYYHPNEQVARKLTFKKGQPDGKVVSYRPDGSLAAEREYKQGIRHGDWATYAADGKQPKLQSSYANGKAEGVWKNWFDNGQLQRELRFKAGKRQGVAKEWYENGAQRVEANYKDGKLDGGQTRWTATGEKTELIYKDGVLVK